VYLWGGYGNITWGGKTWVGTGDLGGISPIDETGDLAANGVQLTLSGIPSAAIAAAFSVDFQGCAGRIYLGLFSADGHLLDTPATLFDGLVDSSAFQDTGQTSTITVNLEKELIDRRDEVRRFTHEDQQIDHPGDHYLEYVPWLAQNQIYFGPYKAGASAPLSIPQTRFAI